MKSVFISHNWRDKPLARKISSTLKHFGVKVWIDEAEIKLGDSLIEKIRLGIDKMDYLIAMISKDSINSEWVKKELDVAINQEIEGKQVKVLPILCDSGTELPGFLKGKLYADMSSNKAFKNSLPILLNRLGVSEKVINEIDEKGYKAITEKSKKVNENLNTLINGENDEKYILLKSIKSYEEKKQVEENKDMLDAIIELTKKPNSDFIRYEALRCYGFVSDLNHADKIEALLFDSNPRIVSSTIDALTASNSKKSSVYIFDLLRGNPHPLIKNSILNYFSRIVIDDDSDVLTLIWKLKSEIELVGDSSDPGMELKIVKILLTQWRGGRDIVFEELLKFFKSGNYATKIELLSGIADAAGSEEMWIHRASLKEDLKNIINKYIENSEPPYELALVCKTCFLWYDYNDRAKLWSSLLNSETSCIESFLDEMEDYRLKFVFDDEEDIEQIAAIISKNKDNRELKLRLCNILAEIGNLKALEELSKHKDYNPNGWEATKVLLAFSKIDKKEWTEKFKELLEKALNNCGEGSEEVAFSLLAKFKAGKVDEKELINEFPKKWDSYLLNGHELTKLLNETKPLLESNDKKKITRIISVIEEKK